LESGGVWVLKRWKNLNYSDWVSVERNINRILSSNVDLSSDSYELQQEAKDLQSEYHLSPRRSQLLKGFTYNREGNILEIGCGCGAITRFLGERFDSVISIEKNMILAQLARKRTKGMNNVSILCSPFQDISFKIKFDIIFCIGMLEYAGIYLDGVDPYQEFLSACSRILKPEGVLVLALENEYGLKYVLPGKEPHSGLRLKGMKKSSRDGSEEKAYGYQEIKDRLLVDFQHIHFYFPYPDYRLPSCILSEQLLEKTNVAELIGGFAPSDYWGDKRSSVDMKLLVMELQKNKEIEYLADSFLIHASKQPIKSIRSDWLGIIYSDKRVPSLQTETKIVEDEKGSLTVMKSPKIKKIEHKENLILHPGKYPWLEGMSLHIQILKLCKDQKATLREIFTLCLVWINEMKRQCFSTKGTLWLDGRYIDNIWRNCIVRDNKCYFFDNEWEWNKPILFNVFLIRSIVYFLGDVMLLTNPGPAIAQKNMLVLCNNIARILGVTLTYKDYIQFVIFESKFQRIVLETKQRSTALSLCKFFLRLRFRNVHFSERTHHKRFLFRLKNLFRL